MQRVWLAAAALLGTLVVTGPTPADALRLLGTPGAAAADPTLPLVALAVLSAWLLTGWLVLAAALTVATRVPGRAGRAAAAAARRAAPAAVRRVLEVALGLSVTAGAVTAAPAAAQTPAPQPAVSVDRPGVPAPALDWPTAPATAPPATASPPSAAPTPTPPPATASATPSAAAPALAPPPPAPARSPSPAPVRDAAPPPSPSRSGAVPEAAEPVVVVRPGDSLWRIAERDLTARAGSRPSARQVAAAWPRWWAVNREAVGHDPDLLVPGERLRAPAGSPPQH